MKQKIYILLVVVFLFGCAEPFLEKLPLDAVSTNDYWKTARDLELYVNQFYTSFPGYPGRGTIYWADENSDNQIAGSNDLQLNGTQTVPASGDLWNFSNIRSVNYFLANYQNSEEDWNIIKHYVGEAYFFRAYYYFDLLTLYGDLPWINKPLDANDEELYAARLPRNVVADSIVADLDKAIAYMKQRPNAPKSRLNSDIALLFKSRVCLYEGTWEKYHAGTGFGVSGSNGNKYLVLATEAANKLMNNGNYSIYNKGNPEIDYGYLFRQKDLDNNPEIMLYKKNNKMLDLYHYSHEMLVWPYERGISKTMVESYLCTDGLPTSKSPLYKGDNGLTNVASNRDPRLLQSIWLPGDPINIVGTDTLKRYIKPYIDKSGISRDITGYMIKKGLDPHFGAFDQIEIGAPVFRYAEALLNYAEAKSELGSISQSDLDLTINILRTRAGIPHLILGNIVSDPNWDFPSLSPVINEVRRERRVELAFEGFRKNDLFRWRAHQLFLNKRPLGSKFIQSDFPGIVVGKDIYVNENNYIDPYQKLIPSGYGFIIGRNYLYPIPTQELTLNKNLKQNPGW